MIRDDDAPSVARAAARDVARGDDGNGMTAASDKTMRGPVLVPGPRMSGTASPTQDRSVIAGRVI